MIEEIVPSDREAKRSPLKDEPRSLNDIKLILAAVASAPAETNTATLLDQAMQLARWEGDAIRQLHSFVTENPQIKRLFSTWIAGLPQQ